MEASTFFQLQQQSYEMEMKRQKDQLELDKERTAFQLDSMKAAAEVKKTELEIKQQELALQAKELEMLREKQVVNTASPSKVRDITLVQNTCTKRMFSQQTVLTNTFHMIDCRARRTVRTGSWLGYRSWVSYQARLQRRRPSWMHSCTTVRARHLKVFYHSRVHETSEE